MAAAVSVSSYAGPLPPPDILKQYIEPGLADRIVTMAEGQARHRQSLESAVILSRAGSERQGQWLGFAIALVTIVGSFGLISIGKDAVGISGVIGTVTTLGGVFVYGRYSQKKENEQKRAAIAESPDNSILRPPNDT